MFRRNYNDKEVIPRGLNSPSTDGKRPMTNRPSCFRANSGLARGFTRLNHDRHYTT